MYSFIENVLQYSITFFAILDPIGVSAIMLSMVHTNITKQEVAKVAYKVSATIIVAFFIVLFGGNIILQIFGINENSIKVIGGIVLILMSIRMIQGSSEDKNKIAQKNDENDEVEIHNDLSIIPIAIPITFGPGIFSTIIIVRQQTIEFYDTISIIIAFLINAFLIYIIFRNSIYIKKYLGITGQNIITKIMGLIVGAISVQFIVDGLLKLFRLYNNI